LLRVRLDFCCSLSPIPISTTFFGTRGYGSQLLDTVLACLSFAIAWSMAHGLAYSNLYILKRAFIGMGGAFQRHHSSVCVSIKKRFLLRGEWFYEVFFERWQACWHLLFQVRRISAMSEGVTRAGFQFFEGLGRRMTSLLMMMKAIAGTGVFADALKLWLG